MRPAPANRAPRTTEKPSPPRRQVAQAAPGALDDPRRLVPEDGRERARERSFEDVEIAVADPRGGGSDDHLAGSRRIDAELLDAEGLADRAHHGGLHPGVHPSGSDSSPRRKIIGFQRRSPGA